MENRTVITQGVEASQSGFISKVFSWMGIGLTVSAAGSWWLLSQPSLMAAILKNQWIFFGLVIAQLALVIWLSAAAMRMSAATATVLFLVYSFMNGITLSPIFLVYTGSSVASTFAITAGTFFFFSLYGMATKRDLTGIGGLLTMGLFGVILASLVNMFLKSAMMDWVLTFVTIAVFLGLIAYDTQRLKAMHLAGFESEEAQKKMVILGALKLYLDFLNLFIQLLKLFGKRRD